MTSFNRIHRKEIFLLGMLLTLLIPCNLGASYVRREIDAVNNGLADGSIPLDGGLLGLGILCRQFGDSHSAKGNLEKQIQYFPNSEFSRQARYELEGSKRSECFMYVPEAENLLKMANSYWLGKGEGAGVSRERRLQKAAELYQKVLYISPHDQSALRGLVNVYSEIDKKKYLNQIINLKEQLLHCAEDPNESVAVKASLIALYRQAGVNQKGVDTLREIEEKFPRNYYLARHYQQQIPGLAINASIDVSKDPNLLRLRDRAVMIYKNLLQSHVYGKYLDRFLIYQDLVQLYAQTGEPEQACESALAYKHEFSVGFEDSSRSEIVDSWIKEWCVDSASPTQDQQDVFISSIYAMDRDARNTHVLEKMGEKNGENYGIKYMESFETSGFQMDWPDGYRIAFAVGKAGRWDLVFDALKRNLALKPLGLDINPQYADFFPFLAEYLWSNHFRYVRSEKTEYLPLWAVSQPSNYWGIAQISSDKAVAVSDPSPLCLGLEQGHRRHLLLRIPIDREWIAPSLTNVMLYLRYQCGGGDIGARAHQVISDWDPASAGWFQRKTGWDWRSPGGDISPTVFARSTIENTGDGQSSDVFDLTEIVRTMGADSRFMDICLVPHGAPLASIGWARCYGDKYSTGNQVIFLYRSAQIPAVRNVMSVEDSERSLYLEGLSYVERGELDKALVYWERIPRRANRFKGDIESHLELIRKYQDGGKKPKIDIPWASRSSERKVLDLEKRAPWLVDALMWFDGVIQKIKDFFLR